MYGWVVKWRSQRSDEKCINENVKPTYVFTFSRTPTLKIAARSSFENCATQFLCKCTWQVENMPICCFSCLIKKVEVKLFLMHSPTYDLSLFYVARKRYFDRCCCSFHSCFNYSVIWYFEVLIFNDFFAEKKCFKSPWILTYFSHDH